MKQYLIVSDLHVPYHCPKYIELTYKILKSAKFDGVAQLGDAIDFWQLSTYDKDPTRRNTIMDDVKEWEEIIVKWCRYLKPGAEIHLLEGNHCYRMSRYVARHAKEIHEAVKTLPELLKIKEKNEVGHVKIKWHKYNKWDSCKIGDLTLMHGFFFNMHTPATNLARYRCNTISGHTHRVGYVTDGSHYAVSLGHGSNEEMTAHQPTPTGWQQAMAVVTFDDKGKSSVEILVVKQGKVTWRGKNYQA